MRCCRQAVVNHMHLVYQHSIAVCLTPSIYVYYYYYYYTVVNARFVFHVVKNRKCGTVMDHEGMDDDEVQFLDVV